MTSTGLSPLPEWPINGLLLRYVTGAGLDRDDAPDQGYYQQHQAL